ncbi:Histone-lysine N-methyltransferase EHMT1 [Nymphon striatum]|nr:Histone-lysine N-methyltransferase EHMT1 [Nymphon striatum]
MDQETSSPLEISVDEKVGVSVELNGKTNISNGHNEKSNDVKSDSAPLKNNELQKDPTNIFQKFGNLFNASKSSHEDESKDKINENLNEVSETLESSSANKNGESLGGANTSANNSSSSVGLRPRKEKSKFENFRDIIRARKSIGRSPGSAIAKNTSIGNSPSPNSGVKNKVAKAVIDALKPKRKRKFKGGTYSLFLSKKKKARQKSPRKDNAKNSDEDEDDSEDGSVSVTDSMVTLDSSHEDETEPLNLIEDMDNNDNSNVCLNFQEGDENVLEDEGSMEASKSSEDISDQNESQDNEKPVCDENSTSTLKDVSPRNVISDENTALKHSAIVSDDAPIELKNNLVVSESNFIPDTKSDTQENQENFPIDLENKPATQENSVETSIIISKVESVSCDTDSYKPLPEEQCDTILKEQSDTINAPSNSTSHLVNDNKVEENLVSIAAEDENVSLKDHSSPDDENSIENSEKINVSDSELVEKNVIPASDFNKQCNPDVQNMGLETKTDNSNVEPKPEVEKSKKTPIRFQLRESFTSLLKTGSKTNVSPKDSDKVSVAVVPSVVNENNFNTATITNQSMSPSVSNDDSKTDGNSMENDMMSDEISNDNSNDSQKLVISNLCDEDGQLIDPEEIRSDKLVPITDENQNLTDNNKENFGSFSSIVSSFGTQARRSFQDGRSSIATSVKSRQRIKRKIDEDHIDRDNVSISSIQSESNNILAKRLKQGFKDVPSITGDNGSPMLNGTSPLLSKHPPLQNGEGILKKITTCLCLSKSSVTSNEAVARAPDGSVYCQAADSMYGRIVACCNSTNDKQMHRTSVRAPFVYMCDVHKHRLRLHQSCPSCGLFCTEGIVLQCHSNSKSIHHFHTHCVVSANNKYLCPHCGKPSQFQEVRLELNTPQPLNFYLSREPTVKFPRAKIVFNHPESSVKNVQEEIQQTELPSLQLPKTNKVVSLCKMPLGPEREQLKTLLDTLSSQNIHHVQYTHKDILTACQNNDAEKFIQILCTGVDVNHRYLNMDNNTCLHIACKLGHLIIVHILIQAGASLDVLNHQLKPPIFFAIEEDHSDIVHYLIRAGADLNVKGEEGTTALHVACVNNRVESGKLILNTGFRPNIQDDGGWSPLVWGSELAYLEIVKLLLERGADPYLQDNEQNIALHWAAFSGSVDIAQIYIDHGCPLNAVNINGDTPLHIASRQERYECVVLFLGRQADVNAKNKANELPIDCCINKDCQTWMALSMSKELQKLKPACEDKGDKVIHRDISLGKEHFPIQCVNSCDDELLPTNYLYVVQNCETTPIKIDRTITSLQDGKLLPDFNFLDPPMLFECNRACKCWKNLCNNRVVQDGIMCRLQLFKTKGRGWGVRTLKDIPRGTFVCEYIGELMSDSEADQRADDSYLFDLDNRDGETYCIDARYYGNISRFINHLCEPNVVPVKVFIDHQDLSFPRIAFFSSRDIKAHEELGFDYGEKFWMIKYKWFTCECQSTKCKYSKDAIQTTLENYSRRMKEDHSMDQVKKASTVVVNGMPYPE